MIWKTTEMPNKEFHSVVYAKGRFVVVGERFVIVSTDQGKSWQSTQIPMGICDLAYGNEMFVALERSGRASHTSADGLNWQEHLQQRTITGHGIAFSGGNFFAGKGNLWSSPDGEHWTSRRFIQNIDNSGTLQSGAASGGKAVVVGGCYHHGRDGTLYSSDFGKSWKLSAPMPYAGCIGPICFGDNKFVAHVQSGPTSTYTGSKMLISENFGRSWQAATNQPELINIRGVTYGDGKFVAVGSEQAGKPSNAFSLDGKDWDYEQIGENTYHGIAYGDGVFIAVGRKVVSVGA